MQLAAGAAFTARSGCPDSTRVGGRHGDTRTISLWNEHTNGSGPSTFMVNGIYDQAVLEKPNWFCRDWRL